MAKSAPSSVAIREAIHDGPSGPIARAALEWLRTQIGGKIVGAKLLPIGPYLTALQPLIPASELHRRWHVLQTEPQQELRVADQLRAAKFDAYCPVQGRKIRVNAVKHRIVESPMVTGYVFAGFDAAAEPWQPVQRYRGVIKLVMMDLRPIPVGDRELDYIRREEARKAAEFARGRDRRPIPAEMVPGKLARVLEPLPFAGLFGFVLDVDHAHGIVRLGLDLFGRVTPTPFGPDQIELV